MVISFILLNAQESITIAKDISSITSVEVITIAGLITYIGILKALVYRFYNEKEELRKEKIVDLEKKLAEFEGRINIKNTEIELLKEQLKHK